MKKLLLLFITAFVFLPVLTAAGADPVTVNVKGRITDTKGQPIPGMMVIQQGTTNGTVSDINGDWSLQTAVGSVIEVSGIGFKTAETTVTKGTSVYNFSIEEDTLLLDDVVVIGYQTVKRKDLTGSVISVGEDMIEKSPVTNIEEAIAGRLAGVSVVTPDGAPDAENVITIRGGATITGDATPLYIIDGFPVSEINDINPSDIATIDVLKDASSTAIYGSQGANGVILITTKAAKEGSTKVSYNGYLTYKTLARKLDVLSPYDFALANYELALVDGKVSTFNKRFGYFDEIGLYKFEEGQDWQDDLFNNRKLTHNHNISVTGGTKKTKFRASGSYSDNQGMMLNNNVSKLNLNFKLDHKVSDAFSLSINGVLTDTEKNGAGTSGESGKVRTYQAMTKAPIVSIADWDNLDPGAVDEDEYDEWVSDHFKLSDKAAEFWRKTITNTYRLNAGINWRLFHGMTLDANVGYQWGSSDLQEWWGQHTSNAINNGGYPVAKRTMGKNGRFRESATLTYEAPLKRQHKLNMVIGQEYTNTSSENMFINNDHYSLALTPEVVMANMSLGTGTPVIGSANNPADRLLSFFARVNYSFKDRYLVTFTFRADGSSKFAPGHQWGFFPAGAVAWRISSEPWMRSTRRWLTDLKLRASFGTVGNNKIASTLYDLTYKPQISGSIGPKNLGANTMVVSNTQLANPNLRWETLVTRNVGIDFTMFKGRLSGSVEGYFNSSNDLLIEHTIVAPGYATVLENCGGLSNKGIDFNITAHLVEKRNFGLTIGINGNHNKNNVEYLANGVDQMLFNSNWASTDNRHVNDYMVKVGSPIGLMLGYKIDPDHMYYTTNDFSGYNPSTGKYTLKEGIAENPHTARLGTIPGVLKLMDLNEDGKIDDNDVTVIGCAQPDFTGGFNVNLTWKGFDLSALFNFSIGNQVFNADKITCTQQYRMPWANMLSYMNNDNRYTYLKSDGTLAKTLEELAAMNEGENKKEMWSPWGMGNTVIIPTDWAVEDASYLRIQNLSLGYTIPKKITKKFHCSKFRAYVAVTNLFVLTNYTGYDPEVTSPIRGNKASALTPGMDYSCYPKTHGYTFGLNLSF